MRILVPKETPGGTTKKWDDLVARVAGLDKLHVRVGVLSAKGGDAMHGEFTLVELAAVHEFGTEDGRIPAREPIRTTFYVTAKQELIEKQKQLAAAVVKGMDPARAMGLLGVWGSNAIKKTIADGVEPENAASTIRAKGSSKPLVDTGILKAAYSYEVSEADPGDGQEEV